MGMLEQIPSKEELESLIGKDVFKVWCKLCAFLDEEYDMDRTWNHGGKAWKYEYKYRRGGKTLCALYMREKCAGIMIIFGKVEREKFELERHSYSAQVKNIYDESTTYHDGKWMMFEFVDTSYFEDLRKLLHIKRKPNKK
jgi:Protein of unknown function (DUF3788)